ncbi:hypothetical protein CP532_3665 [Ophiocordyceps camponoti-leonardi (nom. inval.)]|nr:hypothetical protein CP532_3665 [Ophiocordyceps camponoti-leonardi (nom. inval.)]
MADSDGEYVVDGQSDDDLLDHTVSDDDYKEAGGGGGGGSRSKNGTTTTTNKNQQGRRRRKGDDGGGKGGGRKGGGSSGQKAWEQSKRTWETNLPEEDGDAILQLTAVEAEKRRRLLADTTPVQRGTIRNLVLVLDMSLAMAEKDMLPTRYQLMLSYASIFVRDLLEQNPMSQLAMVGMRDGIAVRISHLGGNPTEHLDKLAALEAQQPQGSPSLQNALEMCRGLLYHAPAHGTREVLVVYGALTSVDPGNIHDTIERLVGDRIRVSVVGLAAQMYVCTELCSRTNGGDKSHYGVAIDELHFRELLLEATKPPPTTEQDVPRLLHVGFPSAERHGKPVFCACHSRPVHETYACTRCCARVCRLPADCPVCGLTLVLSMNLSRTHHHLFPLPHWREVSWKDAIEITTSSSSSSSYPSAYSSCCFACLHPFPLPPKPLPERREPIEGISESGRYACRVCELQFCMDCDVFAHTVLHDCPGCESGGAAWKKS